MSTEREKRSQDARKKRITGPGRVDTRHRWCVHPHFTKRANRGRAAFAVSPHEDSLLATPAQPTFRVGHGQTRHIVVARFDDRGLSHKLVAHLLKALELLPEMRAHVQIHDKSPAPVYAHANETARSRAKLPLDERARSDDQVARVNHRRMNVMRRHAHVRGLVSVEQEARLTTRATRHEREPRALRQREDATLVDPRTNQFRAQIAPKCIVSNAPEDRRPKPQARDGCRHIRRRSTEATHEPVAETVRGRSLVEAIPKDFTKRGNVEGWHGAVDYTREPDVAMKDAGRNARHRARWVAGELGGGALTRWRWE